jgi:hypothetical protein
MATSPETPLAKKRPDLAEISLALVAGLALTFTALLVCAMPISHDLPGSRDFVAYWAAGQQLAHRADPYDHAAVQRIEHAAGLVPNGALMMRNPPWALPMVLPLGFVGIRIAAFLWSLLLVACLVVSVRLVRNLHGNPPNLLHWLGFGFSPALICLIMGQTSLFSLLGLALFLRYHASRPFAAGAALWLCTLKPQLFVPFSLVLLLWIVFTKSYRILAGAACAIGASVLAAFLLDPKAWRDYLQMMSAPIVQNEYIPCLSDMLRFSINPRAVWIQYIPAAIGSVWAVVYFLRRRREWDWTTNSSPLMLASLLCAPYCWFYDQCLAIPAMMHGAYVTRVRWMLTLLALLIAAVDVEMCKVDVLSPLYLWNIPVWFGWYLFASSFSHRQAMHLAETPA